MSNVSQFVVGSKIELTGEVGPKNQKALWGWSPTVVEVKEKAVKLIAPGTKYYMWMPKSCISESNELNDFGVKLIRESYIARHVLDGELVNHLGY